MAKAKRVSNDNDSKFLQRFKELTGETATQQDIADKIGTTRQSVGNWLSGMIPNTAQLDKIAKAYNVSINWLTGVSDVKSADFSVEMVCSFLGLDEKTVLAIKSSTEKMKNDSHPYNDVTLFQAYQQFISSEIIEEITENIKIVMGGSSQFLQMHEDIENDPALKEDETFYKEYCKETGIEYNPNENDINLYDYLKIHNDRVQNARFAIQEIITAYLNSLDKRINTEEYKKYKDLERKYKYY